MKRIALLLALAVTAQAAPPDSFFRALHIVETSGRTGAILGSGKQPPPDPAATSGRRVPWHHQQHDAHHPAPADPGPTWARPVSNWGRRPPSPCRSRKWMG